MPAMTREQALEIPINRFVVRAKVTDYDYDPAGSTTSYIPNPDDVATLEAVLDHKLSKGDFYFSVGCGSTPSRYALRSEIAGAAFKGQVSEVEKARSEEMAETARVVDLLAEIRYHVKCDPQMEKSTYTISRTGAQEIGKLLVEFPPRARLGAVIPNPGEME